MRETPLLSDSQNDRKQRLNNKVCSLIPASPNLQKKIVNFLTIYNMELIDINPDQATLITKMTKEDSTQVLLKYQISATSQHTISAAKQAPQFDNTRDREFMILKRLNDFHGNKLKKFPILYEEPASQSSFLHSICSCCFTLFKMTSSQMAYPPLDNTFLKKPIIMEYIEGKTLHEHIRSDSWTNCSLEEKISLVLKIANAIQDIHNAGVIHLDIKDANIIITPQGQAKIIDFGTSSLLRLENRHSFRKSDITSISFGPNTRGHLYSRSVSAVSAAAPVYALPTRNNNQVSGPYDDIYALGSLIMDIFSVNPDHNTLNVSFRSHADARQKQFKFIAEQVELQKVQGSLTDNQARCIREILDYTKRLMSHADNLKDVKPTHKVSNGGRRTPQKLIANPPPSIDKVIEYLTELSIRVPKYSSQPTCISATKT